MLGWPARLCMASRQRETLTTVFPKYEIMTQHQRVNLSISSESMGGLGACCKRPVQAQPSNVMRFHTVLIALPKRWHCRPGDSHRYCQLQRLTPFGVAEILRLSVNNNTWCSAGQDLWSHPEYWISRQLAHEGVSLEIRNTKRAVDRLAFVKWATCSLMPTYIRPC